MNKTQPSDLIRQQNQMISGISERRNNYLDITRPALYQPSRTGQSLSQITEIMDIRQRAENQERARRIQQEQQERAHRAREEEINRQYLENRRLKEENPLLYKELKRQYERDYERQRELSESIGVPEEILSQINKNTHGFETWKRSLEAQNKKTGWFSR